MIKKVELLAPAGSYEALKAAVDNGADAIYLGGKSFSARAFANNFDHDELLKAINYAHLRNVKIYITLNTLLNEDEINNALKEVSFYYENNVDALIIQDLGLYYLIKNKYPDFELHASTQMHIHNIKGIKNAIKMGFKRVVIPRESNLDFISLASKEDIEIECFVHGAICISYSGQCLISSSVSNRSANKGMCAQFCRLKYKLFDKTENKYLETDTSYLLSPKDMLLINDIPKLIKAGVRSFKIEGRMKSSTYVGEVVRQYRKAIDTYYNNEQFELSLNDLKRLSVIYNRNFTNAYLYNSIDDLFSQKLPNHLGIYIGDTISFNNNKIKIKLTDTLHQFDGIKILNNDKEIGFIVNYIYKNNKLVNKAEKNDIIELICKEKINNAKVYKTIDYLLENEINNIPMKKILLDLDIIFKANKNIIVKANIDNKEYIFDSNIKPEEAKNSPISKDNIIKQFKKTNDSAYQINMINVDMDECFLNIKMINEIRRNFIIYLNNERLNSFKRETINTKFNYQNLIFNNSNITFIESNNINNYDDTYYFNNVSPINNKEIYHNIICDIGGIFENINNKIAYYTLNITNSYAYEFLMKIGFKDIILSTELDDYHIKRLIEAYKERNNIEIIPHVLIKGKRVLMYLKSNPFKKYFKPHHQYQLRNNHNIFDIKINKDIIEIIENKEKQKELLNKCAPFIIE